MKKVILMVVFLLCASSGAMGDRQLGRDEILQIFRQLTSQPRKTWISAGIIEATHQEYIAPKVTDENEVKRTIVQKIKEYQNSDNKRELAEETQKLKLDAIPFNIRYKLTNESLMETTETIKYDGSRFYWEINVTSRTDSVKPDEKLADNYMTDQFDLKCNARRIFAWDGQNYTTYALPGNQATVDSTGSTPNVVNGALTAGIIPWGYGYYTYDNLSSVQSSAVETYIDGKTQISLTLTLSNGWVMLLVLDPEKAYAVTSCTTTTTENSTISKQYSNYQLVSGRWVPTAIVIEQFLNGTRLLSHNAYNITRIDANVPPSYNFSVQYNDDAVIEHKVPVSNRTELYWHSNSVDTTALLAKRLDVEANTGIAQNCATIAMGYVAEQLGKSVTKRQLSSLISDPNSGTSLLAMKQFAQGLGLNCRAVATNIDGLKGLANCKAILHIPGKNHFVVLDCIDGDLVWIIDLADRKFYYHTDVDFFGMDWPQGTALLVSNQAIQGQFTELSDTQLQGITGASGYSCTKVIQQGDVVLCDYIAGLCGGDYEVYFARYGCQADVSGSCSTRTLVRYQTSLCIDDMNYPGNCTITGDWTYYYMRACQ